MLYDSVKKCVAGCYNYSDNFKRSIPHVIQHEGGYVFHPKDPGGETKYGITKRTYPDLEIKDLTLEKAIDIYYNDWWNRNNYDAMDLIVAEKVFDAAINMGSNRAHKILQEVCCDLGAEVATDGVLGPKTFTAINALDGNKVRKRYRERQQQFYLNLIARRPQLEVFKRGWMSRASF